MKLAHIVDGTIRSIIEPLAAAPVEARFHPDFVAALVQVPNTAQEGWVRSGNTWVAPPAPDVDMAALRAVALARVITEIDALTAPILSHYPAAERASWPTQEAEAWLVVDEAGTAEDAPLLAALAAAAGLTLAQVAHGVLAKAGAFRAIVAATQALRGAAETAIAGAASVEDLDAAMTASRAAIAAAAVQIGHA